MRRFETGATRDRDDDKLDYAGFLSPLVLRRFAEYMHSHRFQADGELRDSDNWKKGIPKEEYFRSNLRHFMDLWLEHEGYGSREGYENALCAILFNTMGELHETLKPTGRSGVVRVPLTNEDNLRTALLWLADECRTHIDDTYADGRPWLDAALAKGGLTREDL